MRLSVNIKIIYYYNIIYFNYLLYYNFKLNVLLYLFKHNQLNIINYT